MVFHNAAIDLISMTATYYFNKTLHNVTIRAKFIKIFRLLSLIYKEGLLGEV